MEFNYLTLEEILNLHEISISMYGGSRGLRDAGLLESAVFLPQQGFGGEDLYQSLWDKAAALGYSISENQPFIDGNKRTASLGMLVFLDMNGYELEVAQGEIHKTMIRIATKEVSLKDLSLWLQKNSKRLKKK